MESVQPRVSVIMIFLNAETFFREAVQSVFDQTYDNWELLLVDDGSTDASTAIAQEYARAHPGRVRYLEHARHQNRGMSASRNLGIRAARGSYIAFLDADDVYLPEKLARQVAILEAQPAAMVYGATQHWYSWTGRPGDLHRDRLRRLGVPANTLVRPPALPLLYLRGEAQTPGTCGVLLRRAALEQVGGFEESFKGMYEDQVLFYKLGLTAAIFVEGGTWDRYRQHPESHAELTRRSGRDPKRGPTPEYHAFLLWLEAYQIDQGIAHQELSALVSSQLWPYRHPVRHRLAATMSRARPIGGALKRAVRRLQKVRAS